MTREDIAKRVRARRVELGLTLREAAAKCGVSHAMIGFVETCQREVSTKTLTKILQGLDLDVEVSMEITGPGASSDPTAERVPRDVPQDYRPSLMLSLTT